MNMIIILILL